MAKAKAKVQKKWLDTDFLHPMAPAEREVPLADFFNDVLRHANKARSTVEYK